MNWDKTLSTIGAVAPAIATALGGPLAGLAVGAIASVFGLGKDGAEVTNEQISAAVAGATPADLLALKKADQDFAVKMRELDVDLERIAQSDRASARDREKSTGSYATSILATVIIAGFLFMIAMVLSGQVAGIKDPQISALVGTLIGYVSAKADQVVSYFFGSTAQSRAKDATINKMAG